MRATLDAMTLTRPVAALLLLLCTALWGFSFVAQRTAMDSMGPLTFSGIRFLLGTIVIAPLAIWEWRRAKGLRPGFRISRADWAAIAIIGLALFAEKWLLQVGIVITTVTNSGFLTSLYVLFVPVLAFAVFRTRPHPVLYLGVPLVLVGIFLLNGARLDQVNRGDLLVIISAGFLAVQVLLLGQAVTRTGLPIFISALNFFVCGVLSLLSAFVLETPNLSGISGGWIEILYAGVLSTAVAFTLQAVGQQRVPAANAAIILSAESLFAALGAALFLHERLNFIGYLGAAMIFAAILMVEVVPQLVAQRRPAAVSGS
jgi:drug/metabolite transporter (DMT)-like permease